MDRVTDTHVFFWGTEFSNWHKSRFEHKHMSFHNAEQAYMWEKADYFGDIATSERILKKSSPKACKALGRMVSGFNDEEWDEVKFAKMVSVNLAKWSSTEELRKLLLSTGSKTLVEASPYDKIWGIGLHWKDQDVLDEGKWRGQNLLGKALMVVRDNLRAFGDDRRKIALVAEAIDRSGATYEVLTMTGNLIDSHTLTQMGYTAPE